MHKTYRCEQDEQREQKESGLSPFSLCSGHKSICLGIAHSPVLQEGLEKRNQDYYSFFFFLNYLFHESTLE